MRTLAKTGVIMVLAVPGIAVLAAVSTRQEPDGVQIGDNVPVFSPRHVTGPHAGKTACPLCVYGTRTAVQLWTTDAGLEDATRLAQEVDKTITSKPDGTMTGYVVLFTGNGRSQARASEILSKAFAGTKLKHVFLLVAPEPADAKLREYGFVVVPGTRTFVNVVVNRRLAATFSNLAPDATGFGGLSQAIEAAIPMEMPYAESAVTIADKDESGQRVDLAGRVLAYDGQPIARAAVVVYHTDAKGLYNSKDAKNRVPRLRNVAVTDDRGWFRFTTIKPGAYPSNEAPAHVHLIVTAPAHHPKNVELWFEGDPLIKPGTPRVVSGQHGDTAIVTLRRDLGASHDACRYDIKLHGN